MAYPNIEAILEESGDNTVGRVGPIDCVALLRRLDRAIAKAWQQETTIDEVNG